MSAALRTGRKSTSGFPDVPDFPHKSLNRLLFPRDARYDGELGTGTDNHVLSAGVRMSW